MRDSAGTRESARHRPAGAGHGRVLDDREPEAVDPSEGGRSEGRWVRTPGRFRSGTPAAPQLGRPRRNAAMPRPPGDADPPSRLEPPALTARELQIVPLL